MPAGGACRARATSLDSLRLTAYFPRIPNGRTSGGAIFVPAAFVFFVSGQTL
jgi:hypothetical protein